MYLVISGNIHSIRPYPIRLFVRTTVHIEIGTETMLYGILSIHIDNIGILIRMVLIRIQRGRIFLYIINRDIDHSCFTIPRSTCFVHRIEKRFVQLRSLVRGSTGIGSKHMTLCAVVASSGFMVIGGYRYLEFYTVQIHRRIPIKLKKRQMVATIRTF